MEDRTATGFSFYPSLLLSAHLRVSLCIQVLIAAMPLQATVLYAFIPACLLCCIIFSPHSLSRESFLFLKVLCLWQEILGLIYLDNSGSTASPSGFLVFPNFWQISSRALQVDLFVMGKVLLLWLTAKPLILAQGCQEACVYLQCAKCSSGLFSLWNTICYTG